MHRGRTGARPQDGFIGQREGEQALCEGRTCKGPLLGVDLNQSLYTSLLARAQHLWHLSLDPRHLSEGQARKTPMWTPSQSGLHTLTLWATPRPCSVHSDVTGTHRGLCHSHTPSCSLTS